MRRMTRVLLLFALALPIGACDDATNVAEPGLITLQLTDAEGDVNQAIVTIERVELIGDGGPVVLLDDPFTTDLLTLANDFATLVEDVTVEGGIYTQLRFVIPEACIAVEQADESELVYASAGFDDCGPADGPLQMPSFAQSGIKVTLPGGAIEVDGDAQILMVDFDVGESFGHEAGGSGGWVMHPVIHAEDVTLTSTITVELILGQDVDLEALGASLGDFEAALDTEPEPLPLEDPDEDGVFTATFLFLMPDEPYEVSVGLQEGVDFTYTLDPTSPQNVELGPTEHVTVTFEVTSATGS